VVLWRSPTATQALRDVQDTPRSKVWVEPGGCGLGWILHVVPFQRSTSVAVAGPHPTAVQASPDVHDTAASAPPPVTIGVGWINQATPFHRAASGCAASPAVSAAM